MNSPMRKSISKFIPVGYYKYSRHRFIGISKPFFDDGEYYAYTAIYDEFQNVIPGTKVSRVHLTLNSLGMYMRKNQTRLYLTEFAPHFRCQSSSDNSTPL